MADAPRGTTAANSDRTDSIIRAVIILLVAALLGATAYFGYTIWQSRRDESTASPAQRALRDLELRVRANPNDASLRVRYGEALASAEMYPQAMEQFKAAVKVDEKHTGAWLDMGLVSMQKDDRNAAERYFEKVVDLTEGAEFENVNQRRETALFHLGEIALDAKRFEDAISYFKAAVRIRKDASDTYYLLAQAYHGLGEDAASLKQLDIALAFDPNYPEAQFLYGSILLSQGDKINAAVHLRKAADLVPDAKQPKEALAKLGTAQEAIERGEDALADKRYSDAVTEALLARVLDPEDVDAVLLQARVLIAKGNVRAAKTVLAEARKLDPANAEVVSLIKSLAK